jgi:hypothetical protein
MATDDHKAEALKPSPSSRLFRRLRTQFRKELLGDAKPKPSERTLIEQAALAALRAREMRDEIIAGKRIADEHFVRLIRATSAVMKAFREHAVTAKPKLSLLQQKMIRDGKLKL